MDWAPIDLMIDCSNKNQSLSHLLGSDLHPTINALQMQKNHGLMKSKKKETRRIIVKNLDQKKKNDRKKKNNENVKNRD